MDQKSEFERLLARNRGRLTAIAFAYAKGDADDLLQDILLQIWRGLDSFAGRSSIDTWCYRVALNTALTWQRSTQRRRVRLPPAVSDIEQVAGHDDGHDATRLLRQFMQTLTNADRALLLMYLEDMSGNEIADVLGISAGAVRVRVHRIKGRLAEWKVGDS